MDSDDSNRTCEAAQARRADLLQSWQATCDERINKLLILLLIVTLFYLYYGFISPQVTNSRLEKIKLAKADLDPIIVQFLSLRNRYIDFAKPSANAAPVGGSDTGVFIDKIIPSIKPLTTGKEAALLDRLNGDMEILSGLNKTYIEYHPGQSVSGDYSVEQARVQLRAFRRSLGRLLIPNSDSGEDSGQQEKQSSSRVPEDLKDVQAALDLQRLLSGGRAHFDVPNDPVNDLSLLQNLEIAIRDLRDLENDPNSEDRLLADQAREALKTIGIRIGDTITRTFPAYQKLAYYTELNDQSRPLKYSGGTDIGSYRKIRDLLNPPFDVSTISDLKQLKEFADSETDRMAAEQRAPMLAVPFVNASIDRDVVLCITPLFAVLLLHMLAGNIDRSSQLTKELDQDVTTKVQKGDYSRLAPYHLLTFTHHRAAPNAKHPWAVRRLFYPAYRVRTLIGFLLAKAMPIVVAITFIGTFAVDLMSSQRRTTFASGFALWTIFVISTLLILAESVVIFSLLRKQHRELRAAATAAPEGESYV
jgi:hypothetical protein